MVRKGATAAPVAAKQAKTVQGVKKPKGLKPQRKITYKYFVDVSIPAVDGIFDLDNFEKFILEKFKVNGIAGNLKDKVSLYKKNDKLFVNTKVKISKRYLKYLTKRYLKKNELKEILRVISHPKKRGYVLKYLPIFPQQEQEEEEEEEQKE